MKFRRLRAEEIECRINMIDTSWCTLLLFKTARTDQDLLDETVGEMNWQRDHKELKDNMYCGIGIWDSEKKEWVWKWDAGKESFSDSEKGEASDSFKRAGFNWGIGRELYTSPTIFIQPREDMIPKGKTEEFFKNTKGKISTKTNFKVKEIGYDETGKINLLVITDNKNNVRYEMFPKEQSKQKLENLPINEGEKQMISMSLPKGKTIEDVCKKQGVSKIEELTSGQAQKIIKQLQKINKEEIF